MFLKQGGCERQMLPVSWRLIDRVPSGYWLRAADAPCCPLCLDVRSLSPIAGRCGCEPRMLPAIDCLHVSYCGSQMRAADDAPYLLARAEH